MTVTRQEIVVDLGAAFRQLADWYRAQAEDSFDSGPDGRWTAREHLDHLIRSTQPVNMALGLPKMALQLRFGKAKRPSISFEVVAANYEKALLEGGKASGPYIPNHDRNLTKAMLVEAFLKEGERMGEGMAKWSDAQLDGYLLPHPLLGKMTVRELLFFTIHHTRHHLQTLNRDYAPER